MSSGRASCSDRRVGISARHPIGRAATTAALALALVVALAPAASAQVSFAPATSFAVGDAPRFVAVGNFNGDLDPDLAVANLSSDDVSVLAGGPGGGFAAASNFPAGDRPLQVAVGDFNGDLDPDLAVPNETLGSVSVLVGGAGASFAAAGSSPAGDLPSSVAVGDFNGDLDPDLAVANFTSGAVSVLLGAAGASFGAPISFAAGAFPASVAVGDFNGDSRQDLAVANFASGAGVSVLLGNGDGTFGPRTSFATGDFPDSVVVGDFDGDLRPDLAVTNNLSHNVSVLLGNGDGTFGPATSYPVGERPRSLAVGDFNGDLDPDLAVPNEFSDNVSVLLGGAGGSFGAAINFPAGDNPRSVAVGDFDGDLDHDLAVANINSDDVSVLLNQAVGADGDLLVADRNAFGGTGGVIRVDRDSGAREAVSSNQAPANAAAAFVDPAGIALEAGGDAVVADLAAFGGSGGVIRVDPQTGARATLSRNTAPSGSAAFVDPISLDVESSGNLVVADLSAFGGTGGIIRVNAQTGARTTLSRNTAPAGGPAFVDPSGVVVESSGNLVVADRNAFGGTGGLIRVNAQTGARTLLSSNASHPNAAAAFVDPAGVALEADGNILVADLNAFGGTGGVIRVNAQTGARTRVSHNSAPANAASEFADPIALVVQQDTDAVVVDLNAFGGPGGLIEVNPLTGARTTRSNNNTPPGAPTFVEPSGIAIEQTAAPPAS